MIATGIQALLKVKRLRRTAKLPTRGSEQAAGLDLYTDLSEVLTPQATVVISTGIAIELPPGTVGLILDRSSMGKKGVHTFGGVIDSDYRGEIKVTLHNTNNQNIHIDDGDRIAQLVVLPIVIMQPYEVKELTTTERGSNGFGSTGV